MAKIQYGTIRGVELCLFKLTWDVPFVISCLVKTWFWKLQCLVLYADMEHSLQEHICTPLFPNMGSCLVIANSV